MSVGVLAATGVVPGGQDAAHALMAGLPPDSPSDRVDPNAVLSLWAGVACVTVGSDIRTGVVVGSRHVLTAAHVVDGAAPPDVNVVLNLDGGGGRWLKVRAIHVHPGYAGFTPPFAWYDLALLELAQALPPATPIYPMGFEPLQKGVEAVIVGYGESASGHRSAELPPSTSVKRVGGNHLDRLISPPGGKRPQAVFVMDFDGAGAPNLMGSTGLGNHIETSPGQGDSGAPVFVGEDRARRLVGIVTFVDAVAKKERPWGRFGTRSGGVLLGASRDWLMTHLSGRGAPESSIGGAVGRKP